MERLGTEVLQGSDILVTRTYLLKFQVKLNLEKISGIYSITKK